MRLFRNHVLTMLLLTWASLLQAALPDGGLDWKKVGEKDGVQVFTKEVPGSAFMALRGVATIESTMEKLLGVLLDNEHQSEWVDRLKTTRVLQQSSPTDFVVYQVTDMPWPVQDRDFVLRKRLVRDPKTQKVSLNIESVEHKNAPVTIGIRGFIYHSAYILSPTKDGKVMVDVEMHTDPKGALPSGLVNLMEKSWPEKTLIALAVEVKKPYIKDFDLKSFRTID